MRTAPFPENAIRRLSRSLTICVYLTVSLVSLLPGAVFGQTANDISLAKKRVASLGSGQGELQKKSTADNRPIENSSPSLNTQDMPAKGEATAKVALVEYFDYECPYCVAFFDETMPQLLTEYVATGKIKFVVRDFPLEANHPFALRASQAAHCANEQGKFWPMHDELMGNSGVLDQESLSVYAKDVELNLVSFDKCVDSEKYVPEIKAQENEGSKLGVQGTPTFFLGIIASDGKTIKSPQQFNGNIPYGQLKDAIDHLFAQQK
jgi:protein-disulfide isomerase